MATRESSNDQNWQKRKRKGALTDLPIKYQATTLDGIIPDIPGHENLPPLQLASYSAIPPNSLPKISFQQIYHHMILRRTVDGKEVNNYKGLDRAVKHFEAGDISQIVAAQVSKYIISLIIKYNFLFFKPWIYINYFNISIILNSNPIHNLVHKKNITFSFTKSMHLQACSTNF